MAIDQFTDKSGKQWTVVPAPRYIDGTQGQKLLDTVQELLELGVLRVALNLADTRVVNSIGISRLMQVIEAFIKQNGSIAFCGPNNTIAKTLRIMGLFQKAHLVDSVEAASEVLPPSI